MIKAMMVWLPLCFSLFSLGCIGPSPTPVSHERKTPTPTPTVVQTSAAVDQNSSTEDLVRPMISDVPPNIPGYDRKDWRHWTDTDGDCQNTRHEVLIDESASPVEFKTDRRCQVAGGEWIDPYTGHQVVDATKLDVDHMVPLKNAHLSGAWAWDSNQRKAYANDMDDPDHLIAVTASANRQKGAKGPEAWKPSNKGYWCEYAKDWIRIKVAWELTVTPKEWQALSQMLDTCGVVSTYSRASQGAPTQRVPVPEPVQESAQTRTESDRSVKIASISCRSKPESVKIENDGHLEVELTGWHIEDDGRKAVMDFPPGFILKAASSVEVLAGAKGPNTKAKLYWSGRNVLDNDGDTAYLFNTENELVSKKSCE